MIIFQGPVPVAYKDQWLRISGYPDVLDSNACGSNNGAMIIKHHHHVLKLWLQTINDSEVSYKKALIIFDGFTLHLKIDLLKDLGGLWYGGPTMHDKHLTQDQRGGSGDFWYLKDRISKF